MSTVFLPEFDAIVDEQEPEVIVDDTEFEHCIEITVPGVELHQFAVHALDHTLAVTCGEVGFRQELDVPDDVDTRHVTCNPGRRRAGDPVAEARRGGAPRLGGT